MTDKEKSEKEVLERFAEKGLRMFPEKKKPLLKVGTKIKFENGETYVIESYIDQFQEEFFLRNKISMVCYPIDYLIGKNWEIVE